MQSQDDDIYSLDILLEKYGLADMMIEDVSKSEQEFVLSYPDTNILGSSTTEINGFPASEISYVQGLVSEYEFDQEKFHTM